jgi:twitching motility protein PilT
MDATETINRIISIFPPHQQRQIRLQLGAIMRAVICQRLIPTVDGRGRAAAMEILRSTPRIRELIEDKDRVKEIPEALSTGHVSYGTQTFDQSLMFLFKSGLISYEEAELNSTNPGNFRLRIQGIESTSDGQWQSFEGRGTTPSKSGAPAKGAPTAVVRGTSVTGSE